MQAGICSCGVRGCKDSRFQVVGWRFFFGSGLGLRVIAFCALRVRCSGLLPLVLRHWRSTHPSKA